MKEKIGNLYFKLGLAKWESNIIRVSRSEPAANEMDMVNVDWPVLSHAWTYMVAPALAGA